MVYSAKSDSTGTMSQFTRRKRITITTGGTSTPANYQAKVTVAYDSIMQTAFQDIRFNTKSGGYIDYWIESKTDSVTADVWIELPDAITDPGSDYVWMYYGNTSLTSGSSGTNTFLFFDDFADGEYTTNPAWTYIDGTVSAANFYLATTGEAYATGGNIKIASTIVTAVWEYKFQLTNTAIGNFVMFTPIWVSVGNFYYLWIHQNGTMNFRLVSGAIQSTIIASTWTADLNWHKAKITRNSSGYFEIFLDGVSKGTVTNTTHTTSAEMRVGNVGNLQTNTDDIRICNYIANEPTSSIGTAQHQRRTPQFL